MAFWSKNRSPEQEKLHYLNQFTRGQGRAEILHEPGADVAMPDRWRQLAVLPVQQRVATALGWWVDLVGALLPKTAACLSECLQDVEVMRVGQTVYLLYYLVNNKGTPLYFVGRDPGGVAERSPVDWARVPEPLREFYRHFDGFCEFCSGAGLMWADQIESLVDDYWAVIEDLPEVRVDLAQTYLFFSNGGGGYVAVDLSDCDHGKAVLWWTDEAPTYDQDFWALVDEWMVILFDNEE